MKSILTCCFIFVTFISQAQITLRVVDEENLQPLENVRVKSLSGGIKLTNEAGVVFFGEEETASFQFFKEGYEFLSQTFSQGDHEVSLISKTINLSAVVVQAFETERPILEQSASISTISERDFNRFNEISPVNAFNTKPGVRIEERAPASYRISIRGSSLRAPFGVRNVKVYWNGVPFTAPDGTTPLNLLDLGNITTAEVIKGPSGSIYGAGNGGVINLESKASPIGGKISADFTAGDFGLFRNRLAISQQVGSGGFEASYVKQKSEGYRDHSAVDRQVFQLGSYFPVSEKQEIRTQLLVSDLDYQIPGALTEAQLEENPSQARPGSASQNSSISQQAVFASIGHVYRFTSNTNNTTTIYIQTNNFENPFILDYKKELGFGYGGRTRFSHEGKLVGKPLRLTAGGEFQGSITDAQNFGNRDGVADTIRFADKLRATQALLFQQAEWELNERFIFTLGLSQNFSSVEIDRQVDASGGVLGLQKRTFDPLVIPRVALNYKLNSFSSVFGSVSSGFSPPTIDEIRTNEGSLNLDLEAEKGVNYELGYKLGREKLSLELTAFYFKLDETITTFTNDQGVVLFRNAGSTDQKGIEAALDYSIFRNSSGLVRNLNLGSAYTGHFFKFGNYIQQENDFSGNDLTGVAPHTVVSRLDLQTRAGFYLNFTHQFVDEIPLNDANTVFQGSYNLVNIRVGIIRNFGKNWDIEGFAGVDNLLNETYSLGNDLNAFAGRFYQPAPLRNFYAGIKIGLSY